MLTTLDTLDQQLDAIRAAGDTPLPACPLVGPAFQSIPPHRVGVAHLLLRPRFCLFDPTGTGKTPQSLVGFAYLRQHEPTMRGIVLARQKSLWQWQASVQRFTPGLRAEVVGYNPENPSEPWTAERRQEQYARFFAGGTDILISTYHTLIKDWTEEEHPPTRRWAFDPATLGTIALILDEVHNVRGFKGTMLYPGTRLLSQAARYVWGLTATPLFGKLDDLYAVFELVRPDTLGDYKAFARDHYTRFLMKGKGGRKFWKVTGTKNLAPLMARVQPYYLQRSLSAFESWLPDVRVQVVQLDLYPKQRRLYERLTAQMFPEQGEPVIYHSAEALALARDRAALSDPSTIPLMARISALLYSQMAVDSPVILGHPTITSIKEDELIRSLAEDFPGQQVAVFSRFEQVATALLNRFKAESITAVRITGKETAHESRKAQLAFQAGQARVCVITLAGSEALDLQAASVLVFYDLPWSFGEFRQVIGRVRRKGSAHKSILVVVPMAKRSIDEHTFAILQRKENLVAATFSLDELHLEGAASDVDLTLDVVPQPLAAGRSASRTSESFINALFDKVRATAYRPPAPDGDDPVGRDSAS